MYDHESFIEVRQERDRLERVYPGLIPLRDRTSGYVGRYTATEAAKRIVDGSHAEVDEADALVAERHQKLLLRRFSRGATPRGKEAR